MIGINMQFVQQSIKVPKWVLMQFNELELICKKKYYIELEVSIQCPNAYGSKIY